MFEFERGLEARAYVLTLLVRNVINVLGGEGKVPSLKKVGHNESFFEHFPAAVRTPGRDLEQIFRSHRIRAGYAIKKVIEEELGVLGIAMLAECNQVLRLPQDGVGDKYDDLFLGDSMKVVVWHAEPLFAFGG